jgi:hypothetical protein
LNCAERKRLRHVVSDTIKFVRGVGEVFGNFRVDSNYSNV